MLQLCLIRQFVQSSNFLNLSCTRNTMIERLNEFGHCKLAAMAFPLLIGEQLLLSLPPHTTEDAQEAQTFM